MAAVAGPVNLLAQSALQAENHLGSGLAQEPASVEGIAEEPAGLAAPDGHRHIGDLGGKDSPGDVLGLNAINRYPVAGRGQTPGQVLHGGFGPAGAADPLSQEGDVH